MGNLVRSTSE